MSRIATMTTRERKMQAAAICREVHAQDDFPMDLGKKMSVPKDIMLEELSLASNRGSRLFKLRQRRSEKYTFENVHNLNNMQLNNNVASKYESETATVTNGNEDNSGINEPSLDTKMIPNPGSIAPGYGGPLKDIPPEKFNSTAMPKSYHSPWEQAIINDPALADTLITRMPHMEPQAQCPGYKSFNRVATPFGGFSKAPVQLLTVDFRWTPSQTSQHCKATGATPTILQQIRSGLGVNRRPSRTPDRLPGACSHP